MSYIEQGAEEIFFKRQKELMRRIGIVDAPVIFDVGGNVGQSVEAYRLLFPEARITSFEPQPACFATLKERFAGQSGITVECCALADAAGSRPFYVTNCPTASSLLIPDEEVRKKSVRKNYDFQPITVSVATLDDYRNKNSIAAIDILKIDVQGAELAVLKGAGKSLRENRIRCIFLEVIFAENYQGQSELSAIITHLSAAQYSLWDIKPFLFTKSGRLWTADALFVSAPTCRELENFPEEFPDSLYK